MTDALGYLDAETEEVPSQPGDSTQDNDRTPQLPAPTQAGIVVPDDLVDDVLGPDAALRVRPKPRWFQPYVDRVVAAARAAWAVVARPQVAGVIVFGTGILILLLLGYIYIFTPLSAQRSQHVMLHQLTSDVANNGRTYDLANGQLPSEGNPVAILEIPSIHVFDAVVQGASSQDLQKGPGHMPTTPLPGQPGNAVIAGRRATYGAPFGAIGSLTKGAVIVVVDGFGTHRYRVARVVSAQGGRHDVVTSTAQNRLTLVTAGSGIYPTGRLAVIADLVGKPFKGSVIPRFRSDPAQLGLSGNPASGLLAIWWSLLFLCILGAAVWLLRRWTQPVVVYLLAVPVLLLVGLFACESFVGFLPATL